MTIFLSALGIINALGSSKEEVFNNMSKGSIGSLGKVEDKDVIFHSVDDALPQIPPHLEIYNVRCNQLLLAAYLQIKDEAERAIKKYGRDRVAIIIGSGTGGVKEAGEYIEEHQNTDDDVENLNYNHLEMGTPAKFLSKYLDLNGIFYTVSTACSSSSKAFASAQNLINLGLCDAVLVGGSDNLCKLTIGGFDSLETISDEICNPMSKNRKGITLGEGAALFLLTKEESQIALLGVGESSDSYHNTSPDPEGKGAYAAMKQALEKSDLSPKDVDYVNLHGTATQLNDAMESLAISSLFGDQTYCSSTKPMTGHTLGSAGVMGIALCWLALSNFHTSKILPPHIWDEQRDEDLPELKLVKSDGKTSLEKLSICMSNSFAFGGSNVAVIIGDKNV